MQGYGTNTKPTSIRNYMLGKDSRSNQGIYARGNAKQAGMNQFTADPEAIRRRLERMYSGTRQA